ncbi:MAG: TldD/PmbA family protein [Candidatus Izemoplasmatales bacterium]|nr:TldD/PmbA family protein [Candidatus Izemoplasmatales bacterium]MDY0138322.1 TldD/PmbA family protein [Candidatus Izemoplasmatales bacterium]
MNLDLLFKKAKEKGISDIQIYSSDRTSLSIEVFAGEVDKYEIADTKALTVKGVYNNKMGTFRTEILEDDIIDEILDTIIASAKEIDSLDDAIIYEGDEHYEKLDDLYNENLFNLDVQKKIDTILALDKYLHEYDERVTVVETMYSETNGEVLLKNSKGINLNNKANSAYIGGSVIVKDDFDQRVGFDVTISNDFNDFDIEKIGKDIVDDALASLGAKPVPSDNYEIVFSNGAIATLLSAFQGIFSADSVQKGLSLLKDKLNEVVGSDLVTIVDDPFMKKSSSSRSFDDEGVATHYKELVSNGVLKTYLHNLVTAKKDGVKSTGNGFGGSVSAVNLKLEAGKSTLEEMISSCEKGIFITNVQGAHAGVNAVSGDFSLQASGYLLEEGKKIRPVALITVAGNFLEMLKDITMVGNDSKMSYYGITSPSIKVKSMPVSGS